MAAFATPRPQHGFTLVELLIAVVIISVLAAIALPGFSQLIANQRSRAAASDLMTALARARSEAVKRNTEVALSQATGGWANGWKIKHPADENVLLDTHGKVNGATITGPDEVLFQANGRARGATGSTFDILLEHSTTHRCVAIDLSGRANLTTKESSC